MRIDENWETWDMHDLIENIQKWFKRIRSAEETGKPTEKREKHWYSGESYKEKLKKCIFLTVAKEDIEGVLAVKCRRFNNDRLCNSSRGNIATNNSM